MVDRKEFAEELLLRESIRKTISVIRKRRHKKLLEEGKDELELRSIIRNLLKEAQAAVSATAKHANTGINTLEDLLRGTNILSVLEKGYKSLTTRTKEDPAIGQTKQRKSYKNHILVAVEKSLAPEESRKIAGEENVEALEEDITVDIGDRPEDDPDFIDVEEKDDEPAPEPDEREEFGIEGADRTGRNKAYTDFQTIEKVILTSFDDLDNPEDRRLFSEYLIKNLALYFEKYEADLAGTAEEPAAAADAEQNIGVPEPAGGDPALEPGSAEDLANIELEEIIKHLNVDNILENLL